MEYIFVAQDNSCIAVVLHDESSVLFLNEDGQLMFNMELGPNITDGGFAQGNSFFYNVTSEYVFKITSLHDQTQIFQCKIGMANVRQDKFLTFVSEGDNNQLFTLSK